MSEKPDMNTADIIASALCARWGVLYGPAADMATAGKIQRELEAAIQSVVDAERERCDRLRAALESIHAYAAPYRDDSFGALDRIAVLAERALAPLTGKSQ